MATVTGLTAARMEAIEDASVVSGAIVGADLILTTFGGDTINAGAILGSVPSASTTVEGIIEIATNAESIAGVDAVRAVTPASLAATSTTLVPAATTAVAGRVELATDAETITGTDTVRAVTPSNLTAKVASTTASGIVELATDAETITGTDTVRAVTPSNLTAKVSSTTASGIVELATNAEALTGTDTVRAVTPANLGALLGTTLESEVAASGSTTSTTYTATLTGSTTPQRAFVANQAGKVLIHWSAYMTHSIANGFCYMSFEIRDGASLGAGSVVVAASDTNAIINRVSGAGSDDAQYGSSKLITGLTPGNSYNIQGLYKLVTAGTLTVVARRIIVQPVL